MSTESNDVMAAALAVVQAEMKKAKNQPKPNKAFENIEAKIEHAGDKLILPALPSPMTEDQAIAWLQRFKQQNEEPIAVHEVIDAHPFDGAVALMKAMQRTYGWAQPVPQPGFFGPQPPTMVGIDTGPNEVTTIFWGAFKIPNIDGMLITGVEHKRNGQVKFLISGKVKRKDLKAVHALAELTREIVAAESIYRGKALRLNMQGNHVDLQDPPKFMNLKKVNENELVFSDDLMEQVTTNLFTPIEHTTYCRDNKVPLKRGVLLEGPYGTGKTLCASIVAKKCEANGWTFVTVPVASALEQTLLFAAAYQPCVVFVEDIDREMEGDNRTVAMDNILNTIDGIISKGSEIMVVLTSNHAENLNKAMVRPGRLDAILHIAAPDAKAAEKLIRIYGGKLIKKETDLVDAGLALQGRTPATIRECVERSKLYAISNRPGAEFYLTGHDIVRSATGMKRHFELMDGAKPPVVSPEHQLGELIGKVVNIHTGNGYDEGLSAKIAEMMKKLEDIRENQ